jgi:hypothetical protein
MLVKIAGIFNFLKNNIIISNNEKHLIYAVLLWLSFIHRYENIDNELYKIKEVIDEVREVKIKEIFIFRLRSL